MFDEAGEAQPQGRQDPWWLTGLRELLGPDPSTGWMDTSAALEAMAWLARQIFTQSRTDRATLDRAGLLAQIEQTAAVTNSLAATQAARITQFVATRVEEPAGDPLRLRGLDADSGIPSPVAHTERLHPLGYKSPFADEEISAALRWNPMQGTNRVEEAIDAVTKTPRLLAAMGDGRLDAYRVSQATRELVEAGQDTCADVEDALLAAGVTEWTSRRVQTRTRSLVRRLDAPAARRIRRKNAREAINVFTRPGRDDGTTEWTAILPPGEAAPAYAAVDELARSLYADPGNSKTLGQCRAAAMTDLILGHAHVETHLTLLVPVKTTGNTTATAADGATDDDHASGTAGQQETTNTREATPAPAGARVSGDGASAVETALETLLAEIDWDAELADLADLTGPVDWYGPRAWGRRFVEHEGRDATRGTPKTREADHDDHGDVQSTPATREAATRRAGTTGHAPGGAFGPVEVEGIGVIPADAIEHLTRTIGTTFTRALIDTDTGMLVSTTTTNYRPTAAIRRFVTQRDRHCRFPTCDRDVTYCDLDHVIPWPRGQTTPTNLQALCRHHHRAKHEAGWQVTMTPDGVCTMGVPPAWSEARGGDQPHRTHLHHLPRHQ